MATGTQIPDNFFVGKKPLQSQMAQTNQRLPRLSVSISTHQEWFSGMGTRRRMEAVDARCDEDMALLLLMPPLRFVVGLFGNMKWKCRTQHKCQKGHKYQKRHKCQESTNAKKSERKQKRRKHSKCQKKDQCQTQHKCQKKAQMPKKHKCRKQYAAQTMD